MTADDPIRARLDRPVTDATLFGEANLRDNALRAVLDLHPPMPWYEECAGEFNTDKRTCPTPEDDHFYVGDDGIWTCEANRVQDVCAHCSDDTDHERRVDWPCPTLRAIATALGVET